jgi:DNA-binding GntR family transcriptional regulator
MSRLIRGSRRRSGTRPARARTEPAPAGWERAASGLLDCISDGSAADLHVLSGAGLAAGFGVTGEAAGYALRVLAAAGIVVRQPDLTFRIVYACHLPRIGKPADSRLWVQMANSILAAIELGLLEPGKPVLTVRALASCWDASREPVSKAYRELAWLGYLAKIPGRRYTVASGITAHQLPSCRGTGPAVAEHCGGGRS